MSRAQDLGFGFGFGAESNDNLYDALAAEKQQLENDFIASNVTLDDGDLDSPSISDLTEQQEVVLSVLQILSATLSLVGSCIIVFKIFRSMYHKQTTTPYDRIILGLSSCDVVSSCMYIMSPFLLPQNTSQRVWAVGNDATCQALGFLTQLSVIWAIWYNCILSFYFLLTIRFQVKRKDFVRKYELWMHLPGAIFFPVSALVCYIFGWYGEQALIMQCWIKDVPTGCDDNGNCTGEATEIVSYMLGALPVLLTFLSLIINNVVIYLFVRKSLLSVPPSVIRNSQNTTAIENSESSTEARSKQQRLTKEAAVQGFLYVLSFLLTATPVFALELLEGSIGLDHDDKGQLYPLLVLNSILVPLQGFFNVFIYVRPSYTRFRDANPEKSFWSSLKQALFDPNTPRMSEVIRRDQKPPREAEEEGNSKTKIQGPTMSFHEIIIERSTITESKSQIEQRATT